MKRSISTSLFNDSDESNLISFIHQLYIDLKKETTLEQVEQLLNELLIYIEKEIKSNVAYELFSLIVCCFNQFPNKLLHIFNAIIEKSKLNANYTIISAAILSNLVQIEPKISLSRYQTFVEESLNELLPQIQKNDSTNFLVFNNEIPQLFKSTFILNLLLLAQITREKLEIFFPYIFSQNPDFYFTNNTKLAKLIHNIISAGFVDYILSFDFSNNFGYSNIFIEDLEILIPLFADQIFTQIFHQINEAFLKAPELSLSFVIVLFQKCQKLNLKIKSYERIFYFLKLNEITTEIWDYLNYDDFNLSLKVASKLYDISNPEFIFQIDPKYENLPKSLLDHWITKMTEEHNESYILQSPELYIHIYTIISSVKEKLSTDIVKQFVNLFQNYVKINDSNNIIDKMIFSNYPPSQQNIIILDDFINSLDKEYKKRYYNTSHMNKLINSILEKNIIPHYSFCKLLIIDSFSSFQKIPNLYLLMYLYKFSSDKIVLKSDDLFDLKQYNCNDPNLIEFIQTNDFNLLVNMNDKLLMFVIKALIFAEYKLIGKIYGLTKETILPFYSIVLKNWTKNYNYPDSLHLFPTKNILDLFLNAFKFYINSESILNIESINSILCEEQKNPFLHNFFDSNIKIRIMSFLINSITNDDYNGNKSILFTYIVSNANFFKLFQNNDYNIIKYLIDYYPKIEYKKLNIAKLNLNQFKTKDISNFFTDLIENNESQNEVIKTIYFIENFCNNVPIFNINNTNNLMKMISKETDNENILLIGRFLAKNKFLKEIHEIVKNSEIPIKVRKQLITYIPLFERTEDEILINILADEHPENNDSLFNELFQRMMIDDNTKIGYMTILFQSLNFKKDITTEKVLDLCFDEFKEFKDLFIMALDHVLIYHPRKEVFVKKSNSKDFVLQPSKFNISIITKLYKSINTCNYQAFYTLKNIAYTFPFLIESDPNQLFNLILPELENISLLFNEKINNEDEVKIKSSISALSFLTSSLYSNKIMDAFIDFYFNNIEKFSNQQIYCFNMILYSIYKEENFKNLLITIFLKNNFIEVIQKLMNRNISNEIFHDNYMHINCLLLNELYNTIKNFYQFDTKEIDSFMNINHLFYVNFNRYITFLPNKFNSINKTMFLNVPQSELHNNILNYIDDIEKEKPFWLKNRISKTEGFHSLTKYDFILYYKNKVHIPKVNELKMLKIPSPLTLKMHHFLYSKEKWIRNWFIDKIRFPILTDHHQIIKETTKQLNKIKKEENKNDLIIKNYKKDIKEKFLQINLFKILYDKLFMSSNEILSNQIYKLIYIFANKCKFIDEITKEINNDLEIFNEKQQNGEDICNKLYKIFPILIFISDNFQSYSNQLIQFCLKPQNRVNDQILLKLANILSNEKFKFKIEYIHIINFMLLSTNDEIIQKSIKLCKKNKKILKETFPIIQKIFQIEMDKKEPSLKIIDQIISSFPKFVKPRRNCLIKLLDSSLEKMKFDINDNDLFYYTTNLLDYLTPNRSYKYKNFKICEESEKKNFLKIPQFVWDSDPKFWEVFEKNRKLIDKIVQINKKSRYPKNDHLKKYQNEEEDEEDDEENIKKRKKRNNEEEEEEEECEEEEDFEPCFSKFYTDYKILNVYPEFFSFQLRYKLFKNNLSFIYIPYGNIPLLIDPDHLLESSFNQLYTLNPRQWKQNFKIQYINDKGYDLGGLRRDWFIKLTREICNPNYGLFSTSEKNHHQPNPFSYSNPEHLKYFKFAGMIIAKALLQEENVDAHFTIPFLRQILQQKVLLNDLKDNDEMMVNSLQYILDNDIDNDPLNEYYFEVDVNEYDIVKTYELKENGSDIKVTNENKKEYVDLLIDYFSHKSIEKQINEFCDGFNSIISIEKIQLFSPIEFNLLTCGRQKIDVNDLKENTVFVHPYSNETPVIKLFFNSIKKWNNNDLSKLMMFITGSSKVPANGFKHYKDKNIPIKIQPGGNKDRLPVAHTCFNTLDLPQYSNEEELNNKFLLAIDEESFKLA